MNCFAAITCLFALTASTRATGSLDGLVYAPNHASVDYYAYPRYAFEYAVKDPHTGDNKAQWEKRDGDVVKGAYSLVEPDGSLRVVEYWADDKHGFNAVVKRLGPNLHPTTVPVTPIYKAPIPVLESHGPIAPISIGPVAKYNGLASAPLITGPLLGGGAISSASVYKASEPIVVKEPIAPIVAAPAPIYQAPISHAPIYQAPLRHTSIMSAPIVSQPIYKAPIYSAPLSSGYLDGLGDSYKGSILPSLALGGYGHDLGLGYGAHGGLAGFGQGLGLEGLGGHGLLGYKH